RRRHTRFKCDWSSDVCSSDLVYISLSIWAVVIIIGTTFNCQNYPSSSGVFNLFQPKNPLAERDTEQGPPPLPPQIWARYSYNLFGFKCQSHTHCPLHMFEHNFFSPLQLAI